MAKNKDGRPEWFKFWRRNRKQLDIDLLSMESRGIIFTNFMRYFDDDKDNLMEMTDIEFMAFNTIAVNIDEAFGNYEERSEINKRNGSSGGRPRKNTNEENQKNQIGLEKPKRTNESEKSRRQKIEDRGQKTEVEAIHSYGEFGWVNLTDVQYQKLLKDLGQAELDRCIGYIDESAEITQNKNKWKNWNLVVRRCHRYGWGLQDGKERDSVPEKTITYYRAEDDNYAI